MDGLVELPIEETLCWEWAPIETRGSPFRGGDESGDVITMDGVPLPECDPGESLRSVGPGPALKRGSAWTMFCSELRRCCDGSPPKLEVDADVTGDCPFDMVSTGVEIAIPIPLSGPVELEPQLCLLSPLTTLSGLGILL
jgi:hypothetical protein